MCHRFGVRESFATNTGRKVAVGIGVLVVVAGLAAFGAVRALSNVGETSFSGTAADRLDVLASEDATKNLFPDGTTISTDRAGACSGDTTPRFVRVVGTKASALAVVAFYQAELPRLGWEQRDVGTDSAPRLLFRKTFSDSTTSPDASVTSSGTAKRSSGSHRDPDWVGEIEIRSTDVPKYPSGFTLIATASPTGCDDGS